MNIPPQELEICLSVLQRIADDPGVISDDARMKALIAKIHKTGKKGERQANRETLRQEDRQAKADTQLVQAQSGRAQTGQGDADNTPVLIAPADTNATAEADIPAHTSASAEANTPADTNIPVDANAPARNTLHKATRCYICKRMYTRLHFFYHLLCPDCAELNYAKRMQRADLTGRIALVTGGRIKIGYQIVLRLLRDGATVHVTTRFAHDALVRFHAEPDWAEWQARLHVHALDLRHLPSVEAFAQHLLETLPSLDIVIHNAAQTIKRPLSFYQHLLEAEQQAANAPLSLTEATNAGRDLPYAPEVTTATVTPDSLFRSPLLETQAGYAGHLPGNMSAYFPPDVWDADGQRLDARPVNSWALRLHEVSAVEMLETQLVNAVAPFLLNSQLKPLLLRSPFARRFIINVSAMEGQFGRETKTVFHPHTNMAKAALNMMTRTSAADYAQDGIYMNSVDTGWITDENPHAKKTYLQEERGFYTPLDILDGAARLYDPIAQGVNAPETPALRPLPKGLRAPRLVRQLGRRQKTEGRRQKAEDRR